jgi:sugar O-acyltransferase (sialic acid O-acetyltransferase NeuD family)
MPKKRSRHADSISTTLTITEIPKCMKSEKIIIFGSSGHARSIAEILEKLDYEIVGFIDSYLPKGQKVLNYKTIGNEENLINSEKLFGTNNVAIGVGDIKGRNKVVEKIRSLNASVKFPTIISPDATISKYSKIGEGTVVFNNSFINVECVIGKFCIINSASIVEQNTQICDYCTISPAVNIGGDVKIEEFSFIGSSATIIQKRTIGKHVVIGAGAVVTRNIPDNVLAVGIPAIVKKDNYKNDKLLK